jgi:regulator of replication initiation timing
MIVGETQEVREQVSRWIEDGQNHYLGAVSRVLQDYDRLQAAVESAERENEQLRGLVYENEKLRNRLESSDNESEQLREEVKQLRAGTDRHLREREEIADALTRVMNEAITRLRTQAA